MHYLTKLSRQSFGAFALAILCVFSPSVFAEDGIFFLDQDTSIMDRVTNEGTLQLVLDARTESCADEAYEHALEKLAKKLDSGELTVESEKFLKEENKRLFKCLKKSVKDLKKDEVIDKDEEKELKETIKQAKKDGYVYEGGDGEILTSTLNGRVTTADGVVVADGVSVSANGDDGSSVSTFTTAGEFSLLLNAGVDYVINLNGMGYSNQASTVTAPSVDGSVDIELSMIQRFDAGSFMGTDAAVIIGEDGASVSVDANSFVRPDGSPANGIINVSITPVNVSNSASLATFPGEFTGTPLETGAADVTIASLGTVEVLFTSTDANGNTEILDLANDAVAEVLIPMYYSTYPDGSPISVGDEIELWYLDEESGLWVQDGLDADGNITGLGEVVAAPTPTGFALKARVTHFTWWNCDVSIDAASVNITVEGFADGGVGNSVSISATTTADIGWRSNSVSTVTSFGVATGPLFVPSTGPVCITATLTLLDGTSVSINEPCREYPSGQVTDLLLTLNLDSTTLDIESDPQEFLDVVSNENIVETEERAVNLFVEQVRLFPVTPTNGVTYAVSPATPLPAGLTLDQYSATRAKIAGIASVPGDYTVTVIATSTENPALVDTVTINYTITPELLAPKFIGPADNSYIHNVYMGNNLDRQSGDFFTHNLNSRALSSVGGGATYWELIPAVNGAPVPTWLAIDASTGVLSYVGSLPSAENPYFNDEWDGRVIAANGIGSDEMGLSVDMKVIDELVIEVLPNSYVEIDAVTGAIIIPGQVGDAIGYSGEIILRPETFEPNPVTYTIVSGALPQGMYTRVTPFYDDRLYIHGAPAVAGDYPVVFEGNDGVVTRQITLVFSISGEPNFDIDISSGSYDLSSDIPEGAFAWELIQAVDGDPVPTSLSIDNNGVITWDQSDFLDWSGQVVVANQFEETINQEIRVYGLPIAQ